MDALMKKNARNSISKSAWTQQKESAMCLNTNLDYKSKALTQKKPVKETRKK